MERSTYSIVAYAHCGRNIGVCPKAALGEIDALFLKVLKFLNRC